MNECYPVELTRTADHQLRIVWSDQITQELPNRFLRQQCPCAHCREKATATPASPAMLPILAPADLMPLEILEMRPVGNYGFNIQFSDGHASGIYTLDWLREQLA
jgi:DUF971 family protein